ncbi:MAG TPA: DUF2628 domain-containing protein [Pirellulales bacterium]|jgi:hypothetical protein
MSQTLAIEDVDNPYRTHGYSTPLPMLDASPPNVDELRAFVGPNFDYFLRKWGPRLQNPASEVGMNWMAFFFPTFWFAYRRMYRAAIAVYVIGFVLSIASEIIFLGFLDKQRAPFFIGRVVIGIVCGLGANAWYLSRAQKAIAHARQEGFTGDQLMLVLSQRGGGSRAALTWVALFFVVWLLISSVVVAGCRTAQGFAPAKVAAEQFFEQMNAGHRDAAFALCSKRCQEVTSEEQLRDMWEVFEASQGHVQTWTLDGVSMSTHNNSGVLVLTYRLVREHGDSKVQFTFVNEEGRWVIQGINLHG